MSVRIIGGSRKGATLATLPGTDTRPLLGRVRQSLFNILGQRVLDARMMDLFAGSGAVGLEAISRGAQWVTFVDSSPAAVDIVRRNIAKLRVEESTRVVKAALPGILDTLPMPRDFERYDLVSIMPPYGLRLLPPTLERLARREQFLAPGALVVGQFETGEPIPETPPPPLSQIEERVYGQTHLVFWEWDA